MRNLGMRVNLNNVIGVYACPEKELVENYLDILKALMELTRLEDATPSESRVIHGFLAWIDEISTKEVNEDEYKVKNASYVYANLNTGRNVIFLLCVPYEGGITTWRSDSATVKSMMKATPVQFD